MNIDELTLGQIKQLRELFGDSQKVSAQGLGSEFIGKKIIIRTYSAGVWFGTLEQKSGNEVILTNARRMWRWWAAKSISLSAVANYGINQDKSKICPAVEKQWLEAVEIMPCTQVACDSIEGAKDVEAS